MWVPREFMQVRGSQLFAYTKEEEEVFRSAFIRGFVMTCRLPGHRCNKKLIVKPPKEMGPAKETAESHLPVAPEKLVSPQSMHTQTIIDMRGSRY